MTEKKPVVVPAAEPELSEETRRLVRGLEAFAYACNIGEEQFVLGLHAVLSKREVAAAAAAMPATSPLRDAVVKAGADG